jgi:hypothetical protein
LIEIIFFETTISHHRGLRRKNIDDGHGRAPWRRTNIAGAKFRQGRYHAREYLNAARRSILAFLLLAESPAFAQTVRYELFPEPDVRQAATNRTASAYVVDKKVNQFWICTARYDFSRPDG